MNSIVEGRVETFLNSSLHYDPQDCGTIVGAMRALARVVGHDLDERFAHASLGAGPEGRMAAGILGRALHEGGCETSDDAIKATIDRWLRMH